MKFSKTISTLLVSMLMVGVGLYAYKFYENDTSVKREKAQAQKEAKKQAGEDSSGKWQNLFEKTKQAVTSRVSSATNAISSSKKPYLAIIMDDIAYPRQFEDLQALGLKITPSFFPVSYYSPQTANLASKSEFYMVHLPLEAMSTQSPKFEWIRVNMDIAKIQEIIAKIKKDFPKLAYINNHTGSKFSSSFRDMQRLLYVMDLYGIDFVDSRTSANTQAPRIYEESSRALLSRDVFLDNEQNVAYINYQIRQAIETAKQKGYAIAICHPHSATFKALKKAKSTLLNEVNLVYVKDLPNAKNRPRLQIALDEKTKSKINPKLFEGIPDSRYANIDNTMFAEVKREKINPQVTPPNASLSVTKQAGFSKTPSQTSQIAQFSPKTTHNPSTPKSTNTTNATQHIPKPTYQKPYTPPTPPKSKPYNVCSGDELEAFVSGCGGSGDVGQSVKEYQQSVKNNKGGDFLNISMCKDAGGKWQNGKCQSPKSASSYSSQGISLEGF